MLGFLKPTQGNICYRQANLDCNRTDVIKSIAYLPQIETAPESLTVFDYLLMGRTPYIAPFSLPDDKDMELVKNYAEIVEVNQLLDYQLGRISGGELQRVRIGRALAQESELILLDEPITHLDLIAKYAIRRMIRDLRSLGKTIIFTTHDPIEALEIADNAIIISSDQQLRFGKTEKIVTGKNLTSCFNVPINIFHTEAGFSCVVEKSI